MPALHLRYKQDAFDPRLVMLTKAFYQARPWRGTDEDLHRKYSTWLHGACTLYRLPQAQLIYQPARGSGSTFGQYIPAAEGSAVVVLRRWSVISLWHQFRHHMQAHSEEGAYESEMEEAQDAQAWATSLMYVTRRRQFCRMAAAGRIAGVQPEDVR